MFPVGLFNGGPVSSPVLSENGTFLSFSDPWIGGRAYPVDMAGFAISVHHFVKVSFVTKQSITVPIKCSLFKVYLVTTKFCYIVSLIT